MDIEYGLFVWNYEKEKRNIAKHDVSFIKATKAFQDSLRLIFVDTKHSHYEERYFCIGNDGDGILTIRFTMRGNLIRIIGAPVIGAMDRTYMKKKIKYTNEFSKEHKISPKSLKIVNDFLPSPKELFSKDDKIKITIEIDIETYEFFQKLATTFDKKYQPLIREILKQYAKKYKNKLAS